MLRQDLVLFRNDRKPYLLLTPGQEAVRQMVLRKIRDGIYSFVPRSCLCGSGENQAVLISEKDRYGIFQRIVMCTNCSLIYSVFQMDASSSKRFYEEVYRKLYDPDGWTASQAFQKQYQRGCEIQKLAKPYFPPGKRLHVLDIGCNAGGFLKPFADKGDDVCGIDLDDRYFAFGESQGVGNLFKSSLAELMPQQKSFDLILDSHVLEHTDDPVAELRRIKALLSDGGFVYLEVPDFDPAVKADLLAEIENAHNWYFDEFYLMQMLASMGFQVMEVRKPFHLGILARKGPRDVPETALYRGPFPERCRIKIEALRRISLRNRWYMPVQGVLRFIRKTKRVVIPALTC
ncbi:MAG: class I SAM-dependent methyltransferase [Candidatus Omnitrophota bacterium]|nr:class I SAM-dependent methyltransferase [Candidatus Omnitrophota bacterium]MDZ4242875.1 class I SAM-dependent methyltransferase [Candidatus Omnitrophota bacterium]